VVVSMNDGFINKFVTKVKDKFTKNKSTYHDFSEYAFSTEELENINKQNKQKIQELKQDIFSNKKDSNDKVNTDEVLSKIEANIEALNEVTDAIEEDEFVEEIPQEKELLNEEILEEKEEIQPKNSFINLSFEHQKLVMDKWQEIKSNKIDKDIIDGKDLLNHNYTITYADDAARFIHYIRKEYEIVICYLIGFNNEKQGIYDKTIFSDKVDNEWKYLSSYIKMLEKIRKNK